MREREIVRLPKNVPFWRLLISHFSRIFILKFCVLSKNIDVRFSLLGFQLEEWVGGKLYVEAVALNVNCKILQHLLYGGPGEP